MILCGLQKEEIDEIEHLVQAYEFAQNNRLTGQHLLACHRIFSETLLIKSKRGTYRQEQVGVFGKAGIAYLAVEPEFVKKKMSQFFSDVTELLNDSLIIEEVFYFASLIHLIFAHIHPFRDGNGRTARLLEIWFIAENLGVNYHELNYDRCIDFLHMLPNCLD